MIVIPSIPGLNSEGILEKAIFTNYSKNVRPVSDYHEQLEVHLTYNLGKIEQLVSGVLYILVLSRVLLILFWNNMTPHTCIVNHFFIIGSFLQTWLNFNPIMDKW